MIKNLQEVLENPKDYFHGNSNSFMYQVEGASYKTMSTLYEDVTKENLLEMAEEQGEGEELTIIKLSEYDGSDIAEFWSNQLEDMNYHSQTGMPSEIAYVLGKHIEDKELITKIMWDMKKNVLS